MRCEALIVRLFDWILILKIYRKVLIYIVGLPGLEPGTKGL